MASPTNHNVATVAAIAVVATIAANARSSKVTAVVHVSPDYLTNAPAIANSGVSPTPQQKKKVRWGMPILVAVFVFCFIGATYVESWIPTYIGALFLGIGGAWTCIHRLKEENNVPLDDDSYNFPIGLAGVGGSLVAGSAVVPLLEAIKAL